VVLKNEPHFLVLKSFKGFWAFWDC